MLFSDSIIIIIWVLEKVQIKKLIKYYLILGFFFSFSLNEKYELFPTVKPSDSEALWLFSQPLRLFIPEMQL